VRKLFPFFFDGVAAKEEHICFANQNGVKEVSPVATGDLGRCPKSPGRFLQKATQKLSK
jgi:hypothetical protein